MGNDYDEIKHRLPRLTAAELIDLRRGITALLGIGGAPERSPGGQHGWDDVILTAIVTTLRDHQAVALPKGRLKAMRGHATLTENLVPLSEWIERQADSYVQRRALIEVGIEKLYLHFMQSGRAHGANDLMAAAHLFPEILNRAFPGYVDAGLLHLIVREREPHGERPSGASLTRTHQRQANPLGNVRPTPSRRSQT